jgi:formate dehydrogenase alpha subunit
VAGLATAFGSGAMTNSIGDIEKAQVILVIGSNTTEAHPIIALKIKKAVRENGTRLIVIDPREIRLTYFADLWLAPKPGTNIAVINGLMKVIIDKGLVDENFITARTEGYEDLSKNLVDYQPEKVARISGVPAEELIKAAELFGKAERASIIYSMGITQHTMGTDNVFALANLAMLTGNIGKPGAGLNPLRGQNNVQGACDMGCLPNVLPGYQAIADQKIRDKFTSAWGCQLPDSPGLTVVEMLEAAASGQIKAMYIMGENPMVSDPDLAHVEQGLKSLDFLVVQDIFLTETAELADVVLPAASFAEKDGTFTNTERRVQRVRKAINPPGEAKPDWQIICLLSKKMGRPMVYASTSEIMAEIASLTPAYGGITFERLENGGLQWPCPNENHPGTPILHIDRFTRGKGRFIPVQHRSSAELPDKNYPLLLTTGRSLYQYHTGSMTRRVRGLNELSHENWLEINPKDAKKYGIKDGKLVTVISRRGQVMAKARVTERIIKGTVFMPFHFAEKAANRLTNTALDPQAKIPELKVCAVRVETVDNQ